MASPSSIPDATASSTVRRPLVARRLTFAGVLLLYGIACVLPALTFVRPERPETWYGIHCLALGWLGLFLWQFAWLANFLVAAGLILLAFRAWRAALICAIVALALGADTFLLFGSELPADEAGVNKMQLHVLESGFYVWITSIAVLGAGSAVLCRRARASACSSIPPGRGAGDSPGGRRGNQSA